jgi:hypothetical protein
VLQLVDHKFAVFLFLDQAPGNLLLPCDDRAVVLDAPDGEAANRPEHHQKRNSCGIGHGIAEIHGKSEQAACNRRQDSDPEAAEGGGEEYGRKIRRKKYVGPDMGKTPAHGCGQGQAEGRKGKAQSQ